MQNKRQEQLLAILSERGDWMTSRQLAGLLHFCAKRVFSFEFVIISPFHEF